MSPKRVLAFVLALGNDSHLGSLPEAHSKPGLHFAHGYRLVDFALSNLVNSEIANVYVLLRPKPHSLIEHVRRVWQRSCHDHSHFVSPLVCKTSGGNAIVAGTIDAMGWGVPLIDRHQPDVVAIFAGDQVCRMDVRQMLGFHEARRSALTVAAIPVPIAAATRFGVIRTREGGRIETIVDHPRHPPSIPDDPAYALASTRNYLFEPHALIRLLEATRNGGEHDLEHKVIPEAVGRLRAFAYDLSTNRIPGTLRTEEHCCWRDVGTPQALESAREDVLQPVPRLWLSNPLWPLHPKPSAAPASHWPRTGSRPSAAREHRSVPENQPAIVASPWFDTMS